MTSASARVAAACTRMDDAGGPVAVATLAADAGCTPRQLQRDFADVLGISPRQYGQAVRTELTRAALRTSGSVLDAVFDVGYGSVRAFYEEAARRLGMTPSQYARAAEGLPLLWSIASTPVGDVVAVATPRGLAAVRIGAESSLIEEITTEFANGQLVRDDVAMADVMRALVALANGRTAPDLPIDVQGTAFQARVWDALRDIPPGATRTYTQVAESIGSASSVRAVARACATNKVALAIPCHRVVRADGDLAGYRWGLEVKASLLESESA